MRLLDDQNIPRGAVDALRGDGHDVMWVQEACPGEDDRALLKRAVDEGRVVLTFDKDFGELAFRAGLPVSCGVILLRITPVAPSAVAHLSVRTLRMRDDWAGHFSVVEDARLRMRSLPS